MVLPAKAVSAGAPHTNGLTPDMSQIGGLVALPYTGGAPGSDRDEGGVSVEISIAGAAVLAGLYGSRCVMVWLRGRPRASTAGAHAASATPAMVRALPAGSRLTVRSADGALVEVELAQPPGAAT
jgi:hypothetical protein